MQIKNLSKKENNISLIIFIEKITQAIASNGRLYLIIILKDKTGTIEARLWDAKQNDVDNLMKGKFYEVNIDVIEYRNFLQAKINNYILIHNDTINIEDFIEIPPINSEIMYSEIIIIINNLQNIVYKKIMNLIFEKFGNCFKIWPAALKNHHEIKSGLLWHTFTMLKMAKKISKIYESYLIDFDLLYCGIILHDMGKIFEIKQEIISEFTLEGKLIGHITIMTNELHKIANENNINHHHLFYLKHLIISSHGKLEHGSPIEPHLIEAEILSFLDNFDARIYRINKELEKINLHQQTNKILSVENRWFIKHFDKK